MNFIPDYSVRKHDKGWGVYITVDVKKDVELMIFTDATWIATFATEALADQYVEFMENLNDQR